MNTEGQPGTGPGATRPPPDTTAARRSEQIARIIESRQPLAQAIEQVQYHFLHLSEALTALEQQRDRMIQMDEEGVSGRLRDIDLATLQYKLAAELESLDRLSHRFARDTLHIGVIGRARQGKSRLLQSLSGLTSTEIPDGDRQHCTGVRSTIYHNPGIPPYAEVWFYTIRGFLDEVIAPYYYQLRLGQPPDRLDEFAGKPLPALPSSLPTGYAEPQAKYEHLRRYRNTLDQYYRLLSSPSPRRISPQEVRNYVAQDTPDGQRSNVTHFAVREVKVVCSFPQEDVGQIAMIDLPGLGDTGIGDQERLIATLGQDVDVILFVRMPRAAGDQWSDVDVQLYDLARSALPDLPLDQWSFLVLNRTSAQSNNGDNVKNCRDLQDTLVSEGHMEVVDCLVADCANPEAVQHTVLDRVLSYLASHMTALDYRYALSCQDRLLSLQQDTHAELEKARQALGSVPTMASEFPLFQRLFKGVWDDLTGGLERLLKELSSQRSRENPVFEAHVEQALEVCRTDTVLPSIEDIEIRRDRFGSYEMAYQEYLHELRTHLTRHFLALDEGLRLSTDEVKEQVAAVLVQQGRLGALTPARGVDFLRAMVDQMPAEYPLLRTSFETLATFELSYRGFIQYRIRRTLDELTPDLTSLALSSHPSVYEVLECLRSLYHETLYKVRLALTTWLSEPNEVAFAIAEEFTDQVLRARGAREGWEQFYYEVRADIWASEFQRFGESSIVRRQWQEAIQRVEEASRPDQFQFLTEEGEREGV
jgi:hypothetical protein